MSSASVFYKFKSARTPSRITFDGSGISVWDLKRQIMLQNRMGKGTDFDLAVCSAETEEEYKDDFILPRASSVVARRLPPKKPGHGRAQQYVADLASAAGGREDRFGSANAGGIAPLPAASPQRGIGGQLSKRFDGKDDVKQQSQHHQPLQEDFQEEGGDEESRGIAAMFAANTEAWDETQERMSHATYRQRGGAPTRGGPPRPMASGSGPGRGAAGPPASAPPHAGPERPPPIGYICFRCGTKGHWIHDCPTNDDREFDNRPRFKRTTGIPKSMLKTVEAPAEGASGVMVTPDGEYVVAQVDNATWEKARSSRKPLSRQDIFSSVPSDAVLACALCSKLLRNAVRTPCCSTVYCEECIQTHLLDNDFACAECDTRIRDLTSLKPDDAMREKVRVYVDAELEKSERERGEIAARELKIAEPPKLPKVEGDSGEAETETGEGQSKNEAKKDDASSSGEEAPEQASAAKPAPRTPAAPRSALPSRHGLPARPTVSSSSVDASDASGSASTAAMAADEAHTVPWNPQAAQQIMMMLASPVLPPAMRLQLQMQLQMMQASFMRAQQQQNAQVAPVAAMQWSGNGQASGMPMNMMMGGMMRQQQPLMQQQQHMGNATPPSADSAYMRLPVNSNKRNPPVVKRDRPADFQHVTGGTAGAGQTGDEYKHARLQ